MKTRNYIPVFYNDRQTAKRNTGFSPSAIKPAKVVQAWKRAGLPIEIYPVEPVNEAMLRWAHEPAYVRAVLTGREANGFGNNLPEVTRTFPWTVGSMVSATRHALKHGGVAVSPTSGFHHAEYGQGGGFCTFNGLIVAAMAAKRDGAARVGILDIDCHYGNGTDHIIDTLGLDWINHYTFGNDGVYPSNAEKWLDRLPGIVLDVASDADVVIYQAGADPHIEDPLGGKLTTKQMRERDHIVFELLSGCGVPVAWNLAGGYQDPLEKVIKLHVNTMQECARFYSAVQRVA